MIDRTLSSPSHGRQKGTALVISLVLLVVCLMLGVSSMQASLIDERMAGNHRASIQAQMAAEAGASLAVAEAIDAGCNEPPIELLGGDEGNLPIFRVDSNIEEFYRINEGLTKQGGHARASYSSIFGEGSENKLIIAARGQAGSAISFTKVIISTLCEGGSSIFSEGLVAGGDIHINGSSVFEGNVHANGNLEIKGSYVQWREGAKITEGGGELSGSIDIPEIVFPEADQYIQLNTYSKKMKGKKVIMCDFNGSGNMQDEIYHCSGSLNIVGENISNATLLAEGGINNNGSIVLGEKGGLNVVVIAKGDINLNGSDWIYGALWAGGSIYHNGSSRIYGAVVAKEDIYRNGGMQYTQIKEITNPHIPFEGEKIEVAKWSGVY